LIQATPWAFVRQPITQDAGYTVVRRLPVKFVLLLAGNCLPWRTKAGSSKLKVERKAS
jgi:hypothetical protein